MPACKTLERFIVQYFLPTCKIEYGTKNTKTLFPSRIASYPCVLAIRIISHKKKCKEFIVHVQGIQLVSMDSPGHQ